MKTDTDNAPEGEHSHSIAPPWRRLRGAVGSFLPAAVKWRIRSLEARVARLGLAWQQRRMPRSLPPGSGYDVVVFPIIHWAFRFQRPQQLAVELARRGHRVFYLDTAMIGGSTAVVHRVAPGVAAVRLAGTPDFDLYHHRLSADAVRRALSSLDRLRRRFRVEAAICLVQFPTWRPLAEAARDAWGWRIVYDCMDDHSGFAVDAALVGGEEESLVAGSDLVVVTSSRLAERWRGAPRLVKVLNAADFEHFHRPAGPPRQLQGLRRPVLGYYGAIAEWFDVEMIAAAARARPDWSFALVGSTVGADVRPLRELANVHLLGERPYASLPAFLQGLDVALIPFRRTPLTEATNPVKLYEYLAAGKPIVSVDLPELAPFAGMYYPVASAAELVAAAELALSEGPALREARVEAARAHTWSARVDVLSAAVAEVHPRVAVVIVAFAGVDPLTACLESLWAQTLHPNFIVVVVDNSGDPRLRAELLAAAAREPRLRVVLNDSNRGFSAANNQGIEAAGACDYVVLLNDDTVVTRGWLPRLLRHLDAPGVELVGPVTNWAGNEARIDVPYATLEEMHAFAHAYTTRHAGRAWDIGMLAMFCVAMRRELLDRIGPLDERFGVGMFEDDDFSRRVRRSGGRVVCAEDVFVHHWGRASFGALEEAEYRQVFEDNRRRFEEKWGEPWQPHVGRGGQPSRRPGARG